MVQGPGELPRGGYSELKSLRNNVEKTDLIAWLESLEITQGARAGERLQLMPWQKRFCRALTRPGKTYALSLARGGGKSTLCAGIGAAALAGPLAQPRGMVLIVAGSFEQARIVFDHALAFLRPLIAKFGRGPNERWRIRDAHNIAIIEDRFTGAMLRAVGSDPRLAYGFAPCVVLGDEPNSWGSGVMDDGERMLAALETSLGKAAGGGKMIALGTRPMLGSHWFSQWLDGKADYSQQHRARESDNPHHKATWKKANPSIAFMPDLAAELRRASDAARSDPSALARFKALRLNLGGSEIDGLQTMLIDLQAWREAEALGPAPAEGPLVWGVDLGGGGSFSAVSAFYPKTGRLEALAAVGDIPTLAERGQADGVGDLYERLHRGGGLLTLPGRVPAPAGLLQEALERWGAPAAIAADRYKEREFRDALDRAGVPRAPLIFRGMGWADGGEDVQAFRRAVSDGKVRPGVSMLLRAALAEAVTISDAAANAKLARGSAGGRRSRARDDAAAAAVLAVALGQRRGTERKRALFATWNPGDPLE